MKGGKIDPAGQAGKKERARTLDRYIEGFESERARVIQELSDSWFNFLAEDLPPGQEEKDLVQAMDYATEGGKRLRPRLYFASLLTFMDEEEASKPSYVKPALALECIHAYSLVHDDLPAMDDDRYRRGQLSVHAKFGEAQAILAGDGLLTLAFQLVSNPGDDLDPSQARRFLQVSQVLAQAAGVQGMVGGQALDLKPDLLDRPGAVNRMVRKKTCALFTAAVLMAGKLAGLDEKDQLALRTYAVNYGLAFQLQDDLADLKQDQEEEKVTLATALENREEAVDEIKEFLDRASRAIRPLDGKAYLSDFLGSVLELLTRSQHE